MGGNSQVPLGARTAPTVAAQGPKSPLFWPKASTAHGPGRSPELAWLRQHENSQPVSVWLPRSFPLPFTPPGNASPVYGALGWQGTPSWIVPGPGSPGPGGTKAVAGLWVQRLPGAAGEREGVRE